MKALWGMIRLGVFCRLGRHRWRFYRPAVTDRCADCLAWRFGVPRYNPREQYDD